MFRVPRGPFSSVRAASRCAAATPRPATLCRSSIGGRRHEIRIHQSGTGPERGAAPRLGHARRRQCHRRQQRVGHRVPERPCAGRRSIGDARDQQPGRATAAGRDRARGPGLRRFHGDHIDRDDEHIVTITASLGATESIGQSDHPPRRGAAGHAGHAEPAQPGGPRDGRAAHRLRLERRGQRGDLSHPDLDVEHFRRDHIQPDRQRVSGDDHRPARPAALLACPRPECCGSRGAVLVRAPLHGARSRSGGNPARSRA